MKSKLALLSLGFAAFVGMFNIGAALVCFFALSLCFESAASGQLFTLTLSGSEILQQVIEGFKTTIFPLFKGFVTDFSNAQAKFNQPIIARISQIPTVSDFNTSSDGLEGNTVDDAKSLLVDVPVTIDQWKKVSVKLTAVDASKAVFNIGQEAIINAGYALGKAILDNALAKVVAANFSKTSTVSIANTSTSTLEAVRVAMNANKADMMNRFGIVNSSFGSAINSDATLTSKLFYGQLITDSPIAVWNNVFGFKTIWEYPDLPANSENLSAFFFDKRAIAIATRLPQDSTELAKQLGIPSVQAVETITDPDTGFSIMAVYYQRQGTLDVFMHLTVMWGVTAGNQGGSANAITDKAGYRIVTA